MARQKRTRQPGEGTEPLWSRLLSEVASSSEQREIAREGTLSVHLDRRLDTAGDEREKLLESIEESLSAGDKINALIKPIDSIEVVPLRVFFLSANIQSDVMKLVFERLPSHFGGAGSDAVVIGILKHFRWIDLHVPSKALLSSLMDVVEVAEGNVFIEIVSIVPQIVQNSEKLAEEAAFRLLDLLNTHTEDATCVLECLSSLPLPSEYVGKMTRTAKSLLDTAEASQLPSISRFLLMMTGRVEKVGISKVLDDVIAHMRVALEGIITDGIVAGEELVGDDETHGKDTEEGKGQEDGQKEKGATLASMKTMLLEEIRVNLVLQKNTSNFVGKILSRNSDLKGFDVWLMLLVFTYTKKYNELIKYVLQWLQKADSIESLADFVCRCVSFPQSDSCMMDEASDVGIIILFDPLISFATTLMAKREESLVIFGSELLINDDNRLMRRMSERYK
eukprot:TRINITY_DN50940_c0_g1_i1.p1 TRINITY_DN50940_c0_g1~~TRINITY_DN50940_c0_g1_i1.p1  ORF type:complete len:450 (+),score=135.89 TRINITY_DN50940_c0_g1_i1:93-1442(+)